MRKKIENLFQRKQSYNSMHSLNTSMESTRGGCQRGASSPRPGPWPRSTPRRQVVRSRWWRSSGRARRGTARRTQLPPRRSRQGNVYGGDRRGRSISLPGDRSPCYWRARRGGVRKRLLGLGWRRRWHLLPRRRRFRLSRWGKVLRRGSRRCPQLLVLRQLIYRLILLHRLILVLSGQHLLLRLLPVYWLRLRHRRNQVLVVGHVDSGMLSERLVAGDHECRFIYPSPR